MSILSIEHNAEFGIIRGALYYVLYVGAGLKSASTNIHAILSDFPFWHGICCIKGKSEINK
jgi:hypothetical protein